MAANGIRPSRLFTFPEELVVRIHLGARFFMGILVVVCIRLIALFSMVIVVVVVSVYLSVHF